MGRTRGLRATAITALGITCIAPVLDASPAAAAPAPPVEWICGEGGCDGSASESSAGDDNYAGTGDTASDPSEDPASPGPGTVNNIALEYETVGLDPCLFNGLRRDDEADLALGDIERTCPRPDDAEDEDEDADDPTFEDIVAYVSSQYVTLPIGPSAIAYQPEGDWALLNMDFIVYTDPVPQTFAVELLGMDVTFVATPVHWTWDFGDGSTPLATSSPGNPYPNHDVSHVYASSHEGVSVAVTTSWQGTFQINGTGAWFPVATHATTTATTGPIEIVAMEVLGSR